VDREGDISLRKSGSKKGGIFVDLRTGGYEKWKTTQNLDGAMVTNSPVLGRDAKGIAIPSPPPIRKSRTSYLGLQGKNTKEMQFLINYDASILHIRNWRQQHRRRLLSNLSKTPLKPCHYSS
jgi:hypothetical protein